VCICVPAHQFGRLAQIWNGEEVIVAIKSYTGTMITNTSLTSWVCCGVTGVYVVMLISS
jgi:hypothetical protein